MNITVEIKDGMFLHSYEIGKEKGSGSMTLGSRNLDLFNSILNECHRSHSRDTAQQIKEMECMAYIEAHPELLKQYKQRGKR